MGVKLTRSFPEIITRRLSGKVMAKSLVWVYQFVTQELALKSGISGKTQISGYHPGSMNQTLLDSHFTHLCSNPCGH